MLSGPRFGAALLSASMLLCQPLFAFQSPLSDIAIREAYFLGQRHDDAFAQALGKYTRYLDPPTTGPHIESVTFLTPFAQIAQASHDRSSGYSAQQAQLDFLGKPESVFVMIEMAFTDSYPNVVPRTVNSRSDTPASSDRRPSDFWRDFHVSVFPDDGDQPLEPLSNHGHATYNCSGGRRGNGSCILSGAIIEIEFPAEAFNSDTATIQIDPPEGDPVSIELDLSSLR